MKRHVFGTFLLGATITWLLAYAVHLAGFTQASYLVAAFFGAVTSVATVTDYIEQRQRREYDEDIDFEPKMTAIHVGTAEVGPDGTIEVVSGEEIPPEIMDFIKNVIGGEVLGSEHVHAARVRVHKIPEQHQPSLSEEELSEIEEKFS